MLRYYEVDKDTNVVLNHYNYRLNLTKANQNKTGPLVWDFVYDFVSVKIIFKIFI